MATTINSFQDLLNHFGVEDEAHLSRLVYKATDCGGWVKETCAP